MGTYIQWIHAMISCNIISRKPVHTLLPYPPRFHLLLKSLSVSSSTQQLKSFSVSCLYDPGPAPPPLRTLSPQALPLLVGGARPVPWAASRERFDAECLSDVGLNPCLSFDHEV